MPKPGKTKDGGGESEGTSILSEDVDGSGAEGVADALGEHAGAFVEESADDIDWGETEADEDHGEDDEGEQTFVPQSDHTLVAQSTSQGEGKDVEVVDDVVGLFPGGSEGVGEEGQEDADKEDGEEGAAKKDEEAEDKQSIKSGKSAQSDDQELEVAAVASRTPAAPGANRGTIGFSQELQEVQEIEVVEDVFVRERPEEEDEDEEEDIPTTCCGRCKKRIQRRKNSCKGRLQSCKGAMGRKATYCWERHRRKVICIGCILFVVTLPLLILWMAANCMINIFIGKVKSLDEVDDDEVDWSEWEEKQEKAKESEFKAPERSKLKRPNQFKVFSRRRQYQRDADAQSSAVAPQGEAKDSPRTALRNRRKELKHGAIGKGKGKGKKGKGKGKGKSKDGKMVGDQKLKASGSWDLKTTDRAPSRAEEEWDEDWVEEPRRWHRGMFSPRFWRDWVHNWRANRKEYFKSINAIIDAMQEEEEFDWDNLDEDGNPQRVAHLLPLSVRRHYRFFLLVYWDPFMDLLDHIPLLLKAFYYLLRAMPFLAFMASLGWLSYSMWVNAQYREGDCAVAKLPPQYTTTGLIDEKVEGTYWIERSYPATADKVRGSVLQQCEVIVPCLKMDYGSTNSYDDDRCVRFESWGWGDKIVCYYHKTDLHGEKGKEVYCLSLPSKLEREMFTAIIAGILLLLSCFISAIYWWRKRDIRHQTAKANLEAAAEEDEIAKAKQAIEEREADEARKQRERDDGMSYASEDS